MSTGRKQFSVYRLKQDLSRMEVLRKRSWSFIQKYRIRITSDYYEQICDSPFSWDFEPAELRRQLENGEYLRSAEMVEEQNYSMIDGRMNNMPPKGPAHIIIFTAPFIIEIHVICLTFRRKYNPFKGP